MSEGLNREERQQALYAARQGVVDLIAENPVLAIRIGAEDMTEIYLAGVKAGVEACIGVFSTIARREES